MVLGVNLEDLEKVWNIVNHQEYEDENTGLYIDFGEVSCVCLGGWQIALGGYDTGYEVSANGVLVCNVNYELQSYEWLLLDSVSGINKNEVLGILEATKFEEE